MFKDLILAIYSYLSLNIRSWEVITISLSALPIIEARYTIPIAYVLMKQSLLKVFLLSVLGNMIPVAPLLIFFKPVSDRLRRFRLWRSFFDNLFERTRKKAHLVQKYEALGLMLFVSIPLPITGAWTGCVAASIFKIKFRYAFLAIFAGVILAASFVSVLTLLGKGLIWLRQSPF